MAAYADFGSGQDFASIAFPDAGLTVVEWERRAGVGTESPACHPHYPWLHAVAVTREGDGKIVVTFRVLERSVPDCKTFDWR